MVMLYCCDLQVLIIFLTMDFKVFQEHNLQGPHTQLWLMSVGVLQSCFSCGVWKLGNEQAVFL